MVAGDDFVGLLIAFLDFFGQVIGEATEVLKDRVSSFLGADLCVCEDSS